MSGQDSANWWKYAVAYQVYPRSFKDSNNDGIGDIPGIISKLDYLKDLGIDLIWFCPMYASPLDDNGYDISDYYNIHPDYGTIDDVFKLLEETKKRGMKVMFDLVLNHTSDEHPWFQAALKDPNSPYRNYYYFKEGTNHEAPTNWRSVFGGSVWQEIGDTNVFYLHSFSKRQPDLNWENEDMRKELYTMINWWLEKGLGGFRVDAINFIKKNLDWPNGEPDGADGLCYCQKFTVDQPGIEVFYEELHKNAFTKCATVSEAVGTPYDQLDKYIGTNGCFSMIFDFNYTNLDVENETYCKKRNFTYQELIDGVNKSQIEIQKVGWCAPFWENHDQPRVMSKYMGGKSDEKAKLLAGVYLFLRGTPFIYQGQELGMINAVRKSIDEFNDVSARGQYNISLGEGFTPEQALQFCNERSRDNVRTPMPWNDGKYAGFSEHEPWLALTETYKEINVEKELSDPNSVLNFYKTAIKIKKENPEIFVEGKYEKIDCEKDVIGYKRVSEKETFVVLGSFSGEEKNFPVQPKNVVLSNMEVKEKLLPYQFILFKE